jgi:hypothetical protein
VKEIALCGLHHKTHMRMVPVRAAELRPYFRGWAGRIGRIAWWFCLKIGLRFDQPIKDHSYERVLIDGDKLTDLIAVNQRDIDRIWDKQAKYLIVGSKTAHDLWGELASQDIWNFTHTMEMAYGKGYPQYRGLTVVVVPWLADGLFLLPELPK